MEDELLRYDRMVEGALRGVVQSALQTVCDHGLPGDHHFYITFRTRQASVRIPDRLREQYPEEMTIVLQYQYDDLSVTEEGFGVTLSFNNRQERLEIPYAAITTFADPSVNFALQFQPIDAIVDADEVDDLLDEAGEESDGADAPEAPPAPKETGGDNVVTLDAFRKKP